LTESQRVTVILENAEPCKTVTLVKSPWQNHSVMQTLHVARL